MKRVQENNTDDKGVQQTQPQPDTKKIKYDEESNPLVKIWDRKKESFTGLKLKKAHTNGLLKKKLWTFASTEQAYWKDFTSLSEKWKDEAYQPYRTKLIARACEDRNEPYSQAVNEIISIASNFRNTVELRITFPPAANNYLSAGAYEFDDIGLSLVNFVRNSPKGKVRSLEFINLFPHLPHLGKVKRLSLPVIQSSGDATIFNDLHNSSKLSKLTHLKFTNQDLRFVFKFERLGKLTGFNNIYDFLKLDTTARLKALPSLTKHQKGDGKNNSIIRAKRSVASQSYTRDWESVLRGYLSQMKVLYTPQGFHDITVGTHEDFSKLFSEQTNLGGEYTVTHLDIAHTNIPRIYSSVMVEVSYMPRSGLDWDLSVNQYKKLTALKHVNCFRYENNDYFLNFSKDSRTSKLWVENPYDSEDTIEINGKETAVIQEQNIFIDRWGKLPNLKTLIINPISLVPVSKVLDPEGSSASQNKLLTLIDSSAHEGSDLHFTFPKTIKTLIFKDIYAMTPHSLKIPQNQLKVDPGKLYAMDNLPLHKHKGSNEVHVARSIEERVKFFELLFSNQDSVFNVYNEKLKTLVLPDLWITSMLDFEAFLTGIEIHRLKGRFFVNYIDLYENPNDPEEEEEEEEDTLGEFLNSAVIQRHVNNFPRIDKWKNLTVASPIRGWDMEYVILLDSAELNRDPKFKKYGTEQLTSDHVEIFKRYVAKGLKSAFKERLGNQAHRVDDMVRDFGENQKTTIRFVFHTGKKSKSALEHLRYLMGDISITTPDFQWTEFTLTLPRVDPDYEIQVTGPELFKGTDAAQEHFWPRKTKDWIWWHEKKPFDLV